MVTSVQGIVQWWNKDNCVTNLLGHRAQLARRSLLVLIGYATHVLLSIHYISKMSSCNAKVKYFSNSEFHGIPELIMRSTTFSKFDAVDALVKKSLHIFLFLKYYFAKTDMIGR